MKVGYKQLGVVLGAVAALAFLPARADAQFVRYSPIFWSFEGAGGIALPVGDLGDVADPGPTFGVAVSYFLNPRFALRIEGSLDLLGEADGATADIDQLRTWHFTGGFEYHITDPATSSLFATFDAQAGGATFDTDRFTVPDVFCDGTGCSPQPGAQSTGNFDKTYFGLNGGLKIGYNFARGTSTGVPMATIYLGGDIHYMFANDAESALLAAAYGLPSGFESAISIPITGGIRINIP